MRPVWVLDTNVVISAALTSGGTCDQIFRAAVEGRIALAWSAPMIAEYREVLLRPKFGFNPGTVGTFLDAFDPALQVSPFKAPSLPDPDDQVFLGTALATKDKILVTGNSNHLPTRICRPAAIYTPANALKLLSA